MTRFEKAKTPEKKLELKEPLTPGRALVFTGVLWFLHKQEKIQDVCFVLTALNKNDLTRKLDQFAKDLFTVERLEQCLVTGQALKLNLDVFNGKFTNYVQYYLSPKDDFDRAGVNTLTELADWCRNQFVEHCYGHNVFEYFET